MNLVGVVGVYRFVEPKRRDFGVLGVRRPAVVSVFGEDLWPPVRESSGLVGKEVGFFTRAKYFTWYTVFSYRLWI